MQWTRSRTMVATMLVGGLALAPIACGDDGSSSATPNNSSQLPQGSEPVDLNPADFTTEEPYLIVSLDGACRRQQVGEDVDHHGRRCRPARAICCRSRWSRTICS